MRKRHVFWRQLWWHLVPYLGPLLSTRVKWMINGKCSVYKPSNANDLEPGPAIREVQHVSCMSPLASSNERTLFRKVR
jgi:hypothetical protein